MQVAFEYLGIDYQVRIHPLHGILRSDVIRVSTVRRPLLCCPSEPFVEHRILSDEVDPYKKPQDLLAVSPKGLVPGLKLSKYDPPRSLNESTVIMEYLEEYVYITH